MAHSLGHILQTHHLIAAILMGLKLTLRWL
jgi:hypothetical protein